MKLHKRIYGLRARVERYKKMVDHVSSLEYKTSKRLKKFKNLIERFKNKISNFKRDINQKTSSIIKIMIFTVFFALLIFMIFAWKK